ncbi:SpoIIE family protein phosphatase [Isoptericola sp. b490]|uniref:SpoIIE family protein phosphatase n=1 Tax=Actinotalea lenta TaxID=3064654 RepID=UPI002712B5D6|nr:SpoIIE family protein phosphatase [Isoptericola sp. b490]MDO8122088.1 SpoIIE family protein phosphatase [Isoptericola sp. b490]
MAPSDGVDAPQVSPAPTELGEADLLRRAAAASDLSFTISDPRQPDNPLVWVNPAFEQVTGYRAEDVLGSNCRFLQGPDTDPAAIARMREAVRTGRTVAETVLNHRKDGTAFWNQVVISPITDAAGEVTHFVGIQADVTARVTAELAREAAMDAVQADRARLLLLARVSDGLARSLDYAAAVSRLAETLVSEMADWGLVAAFDERGRVERLHVATSDPATIEIARRLEELAPTWVTHAPAVQAARRADADPVPTPYRVDVASLPQRTTPEQLELLDRLGVGTALVIPLLARGRSLGVAALVRRPGEEFDPEHVVTAGHLAHRAGLGLDNARLYERERTSALALQQGLLSQVPEIEGLDIAATYLPALHPAEVGGDWFDVLPLRDGSTGLAVGDVVGHDMRAAASMGQLRSVLRSYAWDGAPTGTVIERLDDLVRGLGMADVATCVYLRLLDGEVEYTRAGHPAPMLVLPDGEVRELDGGLRTPVGLARLTDETAGARATMPVGSTLVVYSDGLVESRDRPLRDGIEALRAALTQLPPGADAQKVRDHLVAALLGPEQDDDVCLLVVRRPG